jgi:phenylpropionate dioxygenase-like ring-hydroxylating dioxygenase large terminal subunit
MKGLVMEGIPENCWYVVALSSEVTDRPIARTVAGHDLALYRITSGAVVALRDRCSHRRYPLSLGKLVGDTLVCNYHGFSYDCGGRCVAVPGQEQIPSRASVAAYPVVEQGAWIWVWVGAEAPGSRTPPATPWLESEPGWTMLTGMAPLECRHELLVDNLLDLSHETYLHGGYIGTPEVAATPIDAQIDRDRNVVWVRRHMEAVECPRFYSEATGLASPIDRWQDVEFFAPGFYVLHVRIAPAGLPVGAEGAFHVKVLYGLTPSDAHRTYDFWAVCRDFALDDDQVSKFIEEMQWEIVQHDVDALNVLEQRIERDPDPFEVGVRLDRGALAARRMIAQLAGAQKSE